MTVKTTRRVVSKAPDVEKAVTRMFASGTRLCPNSKLPFVCVSAAVVHPAGHMHTFRGSRDKRGARGSLFTSERPTHVFAFAS